MKQLDPKSVWLFFLGYVVRWIIIIFLLGFYLFATIFAKDNLINQLSLSLGWNFIVLAVFLVVCYAWARLSYHFYRYELSDSGFKKESGVIFKRYVTIPYDRIQNVDIYRGIFARLLGLSDLHIQTAGMSNGGRRGVFAEGRLPGLSREDAEKLRDELIARTRKSSASGV